MIPKRGVTRQSSFTALRQTGGLCTIYSSVRCIAKLIKQFIPYRFIDDTVDETIARKMFKNLKSVFVNQPKEPCELTDNELSFLENDLIYEALDTNVELHCEKEGFKNNYALYSFLFDIARNNALCNLQSHERLRALLTFIDFNNQLMTMDARESWYATTRDILKVIPARIALYERAYALITEFNYFIKYNNISFNVSELSFFERNYIDNILNEEKFMAMINNGFYATFSFFGCSSFWKKFSGKYNSLNNEKCQSLKCPSAINYRKRNTHGDGEVGHAVVITSIDTNLRTINLLNSWGNKWGNNGKFNINNTNYQCFYPSNQTPIIINYITIVNLDLKRRKVYVNDYNLFVQQLLEMAQNPIPDIEIKVKEKEDRERKEKEIKDEIYKQTFLKNRTVEHIPEFVKTRNARKSVIKDISNPVTLRHTRRSTSVENIPGSVAVENTLGGYKIHKHKSRRLKCKSTRKKCRRRKQRRTTRKSDINMYYANR
jgi:hypothetical protein